MLHKSFIIFILFAGILLADDNQFDSEGNYHVAKGDTIEGDYFFAGADLTFDGQAESDIYTFSRSVNMTGKTGDDFYAFCQNITVSGEVTGNLFSGGENVLISGIVHGDVYAFGGTVRIGDGAVVYGSVNTGTGYFVLSESAQIKGDLSVGAGKANLAGTVGGKTVLQLEDIKFSNSFSSGDSVNLTLNEELDEPITDAPHNLIIQYKAKTHFWNSGNFYWMMISAIIIALIIIALFGEIPNRLKEIAIPEALQNFGIGALILFLTPFVIILSIAILPAAFIFLGFYLILIYLSAIFSAIALGEVVLKDNLNVYLRTSVSLLAIYFIYELPVVGTLLSFLLILFGMGLFFNYLWKLRKGAWLAK